MYILEILKNPFLFIKGSIPYLLFFVIGLCFFVYAYFKKPEKKIIVILSIIESAIILFFLLIKPETVGNDIIQYKSDYYHYAQQTVFSTAKEKGLYFIFFIVGKTGLPWKFFLSILYILMISTITIFYIVFSNNTSISISLLPGTTFFVMIYSGIRQGLATCIVLVGLMLLKLVKRPYNLIGIICLVASFFFHQTAIISILFVPFFFIKKIKFDHLFEYIISFAIAILFGLQIFTFIYDYIDIGYEITSVSLGIPFNSIFFFAIFLITFIIFTKFQKQNLNERVAMISLFAYCLFSSTSSYSIILARFAMYFSILIPVCYSEIIYKYEFKKCDFIIKLVIYILLGGLGIYNLCVNNSCGTFPYYLF